jgi:hypothetical protein
VLDEAGLEALIRGAVGEPIPAGSFTKDQQ